MADWSTPASLRATLKKRWDSQQLLRAWLAGELAFPYELPLKKPKRGELAERFAEVRRWVGALQQSEQAGAYRLHWHALSLRQLGEQQLPQQVSFDSAETLFGFIGKLREYRAFGDLTERTLSLWPAARPALAAAPLRALSLAQAGRWDAVLAVCRWFEKHPRSGLYLRQLDIPGVDTKFIEGNKGLLSDLLCAILPPAHWDASVSGLANHGFERRFGLRFEEPLVRLRLLDPDQAICGLTDLTLPLSQFAALNPPARRVILTENKVNGLALPELADTLAIFGLGYGIQTLAEVPWLRDKTLYYWGDIDTHGLNILAMVRAICPHAHALLMDQATLLQHRELWSSEETPHPQISDRLTQEERDLCQGLLEQRWGRNVRLEQERIPFGTVRAALTRELA